MKPQTRTFVEGIHLLDQYGHYVPAPPLEPYRHRHLIWIACGAAAWAVFWGAARAAYFILEALLS